MAKMTGGEAVVASLQALAVKTVFGIPSVHNLPVVDALSAHREVRFVVTRHEQGAATMADGYARAGGGLGVCLTSTGPGAANSVTALLEAANSGTPVLEITGQIPRALIGKGKGSLHEIADQPGMLGAICKHVGRASRVEEIPRVIFEAARIAREGRPGPVAVEIPIDVQYDSADVEIGAPQAPAKIEPRAEDVQAALKLISDARRVAIWSGGGALRAQAADAVTALAERLGAVVVTSVNGRGIIDETHPLSGGTFSSDSPLREYLEGADLWIGVGTRFQHEATDDWSVKPSGRLLHINVDRSEQHRNYHADVFMEADARLSLLALLQELGTAGPQDTDAPLPAAQMRVAALKKLGPWADVVAALEEALGEDGTLVCDATMAAYAFGNSLVRIRRPGAFMNATTYAIGPGLPLALGAKIAQPQRKTVAVCGDGGFLLNVGELATMAKENIPVVVLLFNDSAYGILKVVQHARHGGRLFAVDLNAPDFQKLAESFGIASMKAESTVELRERLGEALAAGKPVLLEVSVPAIGPIPVEE